MIGVRLRSPLRWLSATMCSLMMLASASIAEAPALMLAIPFIAAAFLLAPPLGIYRHAEAPAAFAMLRLEATERDDEPSYRLTRTRFGLTLVNTGSVPATDFRLRLLLPHTIAPLDTRIRPLGELRVGMFGVHWFIDTMQDTTAITFRSTPRAHGNPVECPVGGRLELADLVLPAQARPFDVIVDYQLSGGNAKATLDGLRLRSRD